MIISLPDSISIELSVEALLRGNLVAFPTETVYGLGADALNKAAISRIFLVKGRPKNHPLIVHVPSFDHIFFWSQNVPSYAVKLASDFWPGPMTLVLKRSKLTPTSITGGLDTIGLRVPNHPVALTLLEGFIRKGGFGLAAPSANRYGKVSPTTALHVSSGLGSCLSSTDQILDGGSCEVGIESTIIDCTGKSPKILRPGFISPEMIQNSLGISRIEIAKNSSIRVSGSKLSHYSPKAKVILDLDPLPGQGLIAMNYVTTPIGVVRLAAPQTLENYARDLFGAMRAADFMELDSIVAIQPKGEGLAIAIRDRLTRAAYNSHQG
jgi:L-threonylcarbamoyladenylate synthase